MNSDDDHSSVSSENSRTRSIKGSFRRRLKSFGSSTDRISRHSFIDGTRTVSSRLVKRAWGRRSSREVRKIQEEAKEESIPLPACEIFDSIKFDFPAFAAFEEKDLSSEEGLPPPQYPPPPLPERYYDDMFSDRSSNSCSDSQFELLEKCKEDTTDAMNISLYSRYNVNCGSDGLSSSFGNESELISSSVDDKFESACESFSHLNISCSSQGDLKAAFESFFSSSETGSSGKSMEVNSLEYKTSRHCYENWNLGTNNPTTPSSLKSVISEFDPLYDVVPSDKDDCSLSDLNLNCDDMQCVEEEQKVREDNEITALSKHPVLDHDRMNDLLKEKRRDSVKSTTSSIAGWTGMKKAVKVVSEVSSWSPNVIRRVSASLSKDCNPLLKTDSQILSKPDICSLQQATLHNGYMYKSSSAGEKQKDFIKRWCQLSEGKLYHSAEKDSPKESIDLNSVMSICLIKDQKQTNDGEDLHCIEITMFTPRVRNHLWATISTSERCVWMQKILENLTPSFPARFTADFTRAGWCYLKQGINGKWMNCWTLLQKRTLIYMVKDELIEVDLRKARFVGLQDATDVQMSDGSKQVILLDTVSLSLYLIMGKASETIEWQRAIRAAATDNSISLEDQQFTKDDVPVIVEKCINFVYAHGSMSEGIYRRSGSNSSVTKLLSLFRQDSWSVQLSRQEYTEYDVANVLKRFFRDLPEPLFTTQLHKHLCNAAAIKCSEEDKLLMYRNLLEQLKPVNYVTVRKLIGHLYFIHQQHEKNLMPVENLAAIWGPTLMHVESVESSQWSKNECEALQDLILLYPKLFMVDADELERENKLLKVLERYHSSSASLPQPVKPSGDLKMWIYLNSKENGDYVNITIEPNKSCESLYEEFATRMKSQSHLLCLQEVICGESLRRPMHHKERVLDSVLRWSYWDEPDRKDNYLLLSSSSIIREVFPLAKPPLTLTGEFKFADRKMKTFKSVLFEIGEGKLCYYKNKKSPVKVKEWNVKELIWFDGFEMSRNPSSRWAITFIDKNEKQNRCKETPYFGYTIAGNQKDEHLRWVAALLLAQHPLDDLLPPVTLLK